MPKYLMDRIFARLEDLNRRWYLLVTWATWENLTTEQLREEIDILRQEFANIITLAQTSAWRLIAESEGVIVPEEGTDENETANIP